MIALSCNDITKYYGITKIIENISFTINEGDKIGLIGRNGAGKTTLFKILMGKLSYDNGELFLSKSTSLGYLEQIPEFIENTSIYDYCESIFADIISMENKIRAMEKEIAELSEKGEHPKALMDEYSNLLDDFNLKGGYMYKSEIRGVLRGLGFTESEFSNSVNNLSGGQKSRLSIGRLLLKKPEILLLDEPTNHLDIDSCSWLEDFLKNYNGTVIIISHDRFFLDQIINKVYEIENCKLTTYNGNYSHYTKKKKEIYESEIRAYENQQAEIQKQAEMIRRFKQHGTEKLAKRARSREIALDKVDVLDKPVEYTKRAKIKLTTKVQSGNDVLHVENLAMNFGEKQLFDNGSFSIFKHDKIGLIGPNGIGKTTLFKILLGELSATKGSIKFGHHVHVGHYDQEQTNLNLENDLIEEISDADPLLNLTQIRTLLGGILFEGDDVYKKNKSLSGGEKGKLSMLKLMLSESNFLLLDEPTNHLDIASKEALEDAILDYDGTIISISHDRYFLNKVCSTIFELTEHGVNLYLGNYDYYKFKINETKLLEEDNPDEFTINKTKAKYQRRKEKELQKDEKKRKKTLDDLEIRIHNIEVKITELEERLCDEKTYSDSDLTKELIKDISNLKEELTTSYEKWEEFM
jgi:ATP-binding cassette subfamily F protein 3